MRYIVAAYASLALLGSIVAYPVAALVTPSDDVRPDVCELYGKGNVEQCILTVATATTAGYLSALSTKCGAGYLYNEAVLATYYLAGDTNGIGSDAFSRAYRKVMGMDNFATRNACEGAAQVMPGAIKRKEER